jgi:hypothetical protein
MDHLVNQLGVAQDRDRLQHCISEQRQSALGIYLVRMDRMGGSLPHVPHGSLQVSLLLHRMPARIRLGEGERAEDNSAR